MHILENCKQLQAKHNNAVGGLLDQTLYFWRPVRSQKKNRTYYQHKKASKLAKNQRNMQITQQHNNNNNNNIAFFPKKVGVGYKLHSKSDKLYTYCG